jgi:hypothetical protein
MHFKSIIHVLGLLLVVTGSSMLLPALKQQIHTVTRQIAYGKVIALENFNLQCEILRSFLRLVVDSRCLANILSFGKFKTIEYIHYTSCIYQE